MRGGDVIPFFNYYIKWADAVAGSYKIQQPARRRSVDTWPSPDSRTRIRRSLRHPYPIKPRVLIVLYQLFSITRTHPSFEIATAFSINYRNDPSSRVFRDAWLLWVRVSQSTASVNFFKVCEPFDVLFLTWELLYNFLGFLIF